MTEIIVIKWQKNCKGVPEDKPGDMKQVAQNVIEPQHEKKFSIGGEECIIMYV